DFWGTLVQTAEGAVGTILGLIGKLLESLGITGGGGILAGIKGLVTGGGAPGGGAGGGQGILGTLSNVLGITGLAGKIFGAGSPLAGVGDFFQSALGGTITGLAKNLLSLGGTVLAVTTLFNRNASALSRTAAGLYATNQALNVFGLGLRTSAGAGAGGGTAVALGGRVLGTFGGAPGFVGPGLQAGAAAPGGVDLLGTLQRGFGAIGDSISGLGTKLGLETGAVTALVDKLGVVLPGIGLATSAYGIYGGISQARGAHCPRRPAAGAAAAGAGVAGGIAAGATIAGIVGGLTASAAASATIPVVGWIVAAILLIVALIMTAIQ